MTTTQNFLLLLTIASFHSVTKASFISSNTKGLLAALGDFNNDKYTDIVSIDKNGTASIWFYKKKDSDGSRVSRDSIMKLSLKTDEQAVGAIPGDFNADNTLDLAVLVENTKDDRMYELKMFYHDVQNSKELEAFSYGNGSSPIVFNGQPLVLDVNGDQVPDFLGNVEGGFNLVHTIDGKCNMLTARFSVRQALMILIVCYCFGKGKKKSRLPFFFTIAMSNGVVTGY